MNIQEPSFICSPINIKFDMIRKSNSPAKIHQRRLQALPKQINFQNGFQCQREYSPVNLLQPLKIEILTTMNQSSTQEGQITLLDNIKKNQYEPYHIDSPKKKMKNFFLDESLPFRQRQYFPNQEISRVDNQRVNNFLDGYFNPNNRTHIVKNNQSLIKKQQSQEFRVKNFRKVRQLNRAESLFKKCGVNCDHSHEDLLEAEKDKDLSPTEKNRKSIQRVISSLNKQITREVKYEKIFLEDQKNLEQFNMKINQIDSKQVQKELDNILAKQNFNITSLRINQNQRKLQGSIIKKQNTVLDC